MATVYSGAGSLVKSTLDTAVNEGINCLNTIHDDRDRGGAQETVAGAAAALEVVAVVSPDQRRGKQQRQKQRRQKGAPDPPSALKQAHQPPEADFKSAENVCCEAFMHAASASC